MINEKNAINEIDSPHQSCEKTRHLFATVNEMYNKLILDKSNFSFYNTLKELLYNQIEYEKT